MVTQLERYVDHSIAGMLIQLRKVASCLSRVLDICIYGKGTKDGEINNSDWSVKQFVTYKVEFKLHIIELALTRQRINLDRLRLVMMQCICCQ